MGIDWFAVILILAANLVTGWLVLHCLGGLDGDWPVQLVAFTAVGTAVNGWIALVLAELGWFSIWRLTALWLILLLILFWKIGSSFRISAHFAPHLSHSLLLLLWLPAAIWLYFRPHEFIIGGADAGVYVSLGAEISQHGGFRIQDDVLANLDPDLYPALLRPTANSIAPYYIVPAFSVFGDQAGQITPRFYPFHPLWQAAAYGLGGVRAELLLTGLWALLGALAVFLVARDLAGWGAGALALAGVSINALQVWFARYPTTEAMTQFLFWTGLWALARWLNGRQQASVWAFVAGLSLGSMFLVRIDAAFVLPVLAGLALWLWLSHNRPQHGRWFWLPLTGLISHSMIHALWQSRPYFLELVNYARLLAGKNMSMMVAAAALGLAGLAALGWQRSQLDRISGWQRPILAAAALLVLILGGYAWFIRPGLGGIPTYFDAFSNQMIPSPNSENLVRLGWYLSPVGVFLGVMGCAWLVLHANRKTAVMLGMCLLYAFIYLVNVRANPHQIYTMRRYVPAVMPFFVLGTAVLLGQIAGRRAGWRWGAAGVVAALWLAGIGWNARGFISQVDYTGIIDQVSVLNARLDPESIILFVDPNPVGMGDFWGTPLKFLFGQTVFTLRDPTLAEPRLLVQTIHHWQNDGRSVYWVGDTNWLSENGVSYHEEGSITLSTTNMEASYTRKPEKLTRLAWQLDLAQLAP